MNRLTRRVHSLPHRMSPLRPSLNRLSRLPILYQNRRLCHQNPAAQHNADLETARRVLPEELMRYTVRLTCKATAEPGVCDVYVLGTSHDSPESIRDVKAIINFLKPQVVFLELCSDRTAILSTKTSLKPSEFRIAHDEASKYGCKVVLGDRPDQVTYQRMWRSAPFWRTTLSTFGLLCGESYQHFITKVAKEMKSDDIDRVNHDIQEWSKHFPTWVETFVYERDRYMSCTLLKVAREHNLVVAVVGRGHIQGIKNNWGQPVSLEELMEIPKMNPVVSAMRVFAYSELWEFVNDPKKPTMFAMKIISGVVIVGLKAAFTHLVALGKK